MLRFNIKLEEKRKELKSIFGLNTHIDEVILEFAVDDVIKIERNVLPSIDLIPLKLCGLQIMFDFQVQVEHLQRIQNAANLVNISFHLQSIGNEGIEVIAKSLKKNNVLKTLAVD